MTFSIHAERPALPELVALYTSVGWTAYSNDPRRLHAAVNGSYLVLCARSNGDGSLLGLARTVSDGHSIVYLQDLLVDAGHHRQGIGGALLDEVLARSGGIRQLVLLTDAEPGQRAFYESRGLVEAHDAQPAGLRTFVRIAAAVTPQCVITECYGPIYLGRDRVQEWAAAWFEAGGIVHRWTVTDHFVSGGREAAQWQFECTWDRRRTTFDGATICRSVDGLIAELREYQTTAPLYEWNGAWR